MRDLIYPVPVKPASEISDWCCWPDDVREIIRRWNKNRRWAWLSFVRGDGVFKCFDCNEFCEIHPSGGAFFRSAKIWVCDDCLIARARRMIPVRRAYGAHRRAGNTIQSCACGTPAAKPEGGYDWKIRQDCRYHQLAAEFPDDHSIPWNCPTFYDGCNCIGDPVPTDD